MLNVYTLAEAVTTARVNGSTYKSPDAYEFHTDNIFECSAEMSRGIMSEAVEMNEIFAVTEEILGEAAMCNPAALEELSEASFQTIIDGAKKFFDKIISYVKGIIDKLKAYFAKMTGNTDKWVSIMRPKVEATLRNQSTWKDAAAEMYTYDEEYIKSGIKGGIDKLVAKWQTVVQNSGKDLDNIDWFEKVSKNMQADADISGRAHTENPVQMNDDDTADVKEIETAKSNLEKTFKEVKDNFSSTVGEAFGISANTSMDAIWSAMTAKAHSGSTERKQRTYGGDAMKMLDAVAGSKECVKGLTEAYDKHLRGLQDFRKKLDGANLKVTGNKKTPGPIITASNSYISTLVNGMTSTTQLYENAIGRAKDLNLAYAREMAKEYMTVLTKFASYKSPKSKD